MMSDRDYKLYKKYKAKYKSIQRGGSQYPLPAEMQPGIQQAIQPAMQMQMQQSPPSGGSYGQYIDNGLRYQSEMVPTIFGQDLLQSQKSWDHIISVLYDNSQAEFTSWLSGQSTPQLKELYSGATTLVNPSGQGPKQGKEGGKSLAELLFILKNYENTWHYILVDGNENEKRSLYVWFCQTFYDEAVRKEKGIIKEVRNEEKVMEKFQVVETILTTLQRRAAFVAKENMSPTQARSFGSRIGSIGLQAASPVGLTTSSTIPIQPGAELTYQAGYNRQ